MAQFPFLSDGWIAEVRKIREEYRGRAPHIPVTVRMNHVINEVPFGDGVLNTHLDTSSGEMELATGHLDSPDLMVTMSYSTAKAIFADFDAQAAMNAFLSGRIRVDGDITKMLALQTAMSGGGADVDAQEVVQRIRDVTAPG